MARVSIKNIQDMADKDQKIAVLTAYDYATARILDKSGIPIILVGDSLGMVVLGYDSTLPVTMEMMLHHTRAVVRGTEKALVVGDMPFMSFQVSPEEALKNAARFLQESGCQAVKLEGGARMVTTVMRLVEAGIPVMGHIGLTPQSVNQFSGYRVQGRTLEDARTLIADAKALEKAGAFAVVLETVPAPLSRIISRALKIPTIGIGAGADCDGQVQVISDLLGLFTDFVPRHARQYAHLSETIRQAVSDYAADIASGAFPTMENGFSLDQEVLECLERDARENS